MLDYILDPVARLGHWSYLIIFLAAALECAAFFGLLVPGESLMLASGFFAHQELLELDAVIVVGTLGAIVGDNIGYQLGSRLGRDWLLRHGARFGPKPGRLDKAEAFFARGAVDARVCITGILPRGELAGSRAIDQPHRPDHRKTLRRGYNRSLGPAPAPRLPRGLRWER